MKAVRIHRYGGPEVLRFEDAPDPHPAPDELLVAVNAIGVNPADYKFRQGRFAEAFPKQMPLILGMDIAGIVIATGSQVAGFAVGQRVLAMIPHTHMGGYAQVVSAPAAWFAHVPDALSWEEAATLPTPGLTGRGIVDDLGVSQAHRVLVVGAAGAVGRVACYSAKRLGAHVTAAVRQSQVAEIAHVDDVLVLGEPVPADMAPFDLIADTVGGSTAKGLIGALGPGGTLSSVATDAIGDAGRLDVSVRRFACRPDADWLAALARAVARQELTLAPARSMPLRDAAEAHRLLERGGAGKIVLIP